MASTLLTILRPLSTISNSLRASVEELRKVVWPTQEQTVQYTLIVIGSVIVVTALTAGIDYGLVKLLNQVIAWSQS